MPIEDSEAVEISRRIDPANLLPFSCRLEPDDPNVQKIVGAYRGSLGKGVLDVESPRARHAGVR